MLPGEFRELRRGRVRLWVDAPLADAATALGLLEPEGVRRALEGSPGPRGRGATAVAPLPGRAERLHLRPVLHGGWLGPLLGDRLWGLSRPRAELGAGVALAAAGVPVARPALVVGRRRAGPWWSAAVGTLVVEGSRDGAAFLASRPDRRRVARAAEAAGRSLRRLHDAGGLHGDLHLGNLLVRERGARAEVWLADLDRTRVGAVPTARERMAQLMRLYRSLVKRELVERLGAAGPARFLAGYTGGDRELRRALLAQLPRERLRLRLHALAWSWRRRS